MVHSNPDHGLGNKLAMHFCSCFCVLNVVTYLLGDAVLHIMGEFFATFQVMLLQVPAGGYTMKIKTHACAHVCFCFYTSVRAWQPHAPNLIIESSSNVPCAWGDLIGGMVQTAGPTKYFARALVLNQLGRNKVSHAL
jgi:hypothetical protein